MSFDHLRHEIPADIIVDAEPYTGTFNMAMDAALLELAMERQRSVIRIYSWCEPTVTLGHFQKPDDAAGGLFATLPTVRRLSGGGAILHDREVTYSCILPASHPVRQQPSDLYRMVHSVLIELMKDCGADCCLRAETDRDASGSKRAVGEPWLCFLRADPNDILHRSGPKVTGSAQRRRRGVILQHGSILLSASPHAVSVPGLLDLSPDFDQPRFRRLLPDAVGRAVASDHQTRSYNDEEITRAESLASGMSMTRIAREQRDNAVV